MNTVEDFLFAWLRCIYLDRHRKFVIDLRVSHSVDEVAELGCEFEGFDTLLDVNLDRVFWEEKLKSPVACTELEGLRCFSVGSFRLEFQLILNVSSGSLC